MFVIGVSSFLALSLVVRAVIVITLRFSILAIVLALSTVIAAFAVFLSSAFLVGKLGTTRLFEMSSLVAVVAQGYFSVLSIADEVFRLLFLLTSILDVIHTKMISLERLDVLRISRFVDHASSPLSRAF
jgi:hypothetical protein